MSTEKIDQYRVLYSEYVKHFVTLHNYHNVFMENRGRESSAQIRTSLYSMIKLEKAMAMLALECYKENRENTKAHRQHLKELRAKAKPRIKPGGRPKGRKNGIDS
jgi:hypothetical protein